MQDEVIESVHPDGDLATDELAFAHKIRKFAQKQLAPHAQRVDEEGVFRKESVQELAKAGILGGPISTDFGGSG